MNSFKEAILAKLQAKKNETKGEKKEKRRIYDADGQKRTGIKQYKKGGLFDK